MSVHEAVATNYFLGETHSTTTTTTLSWLLDAIPCVCTTLHLHDPASAQLFVVPVLSNSILPNIVYKEGNTACWKDRCGRDSLVYIDSVLWNSTWFQRHAGNDRIAYNGCFGMERPEVNGERLHNIKKCNMITYEDQKPNNQSGLTFPKLYTGTLCQMSSEKLYDAVLAGLLPNILKERKRKLFMPRSNMCQWMNEIDEYSMPFCGRGKQCPALAQSRFGFHIWGDSFGANRLQDILLSGTIPIFTMKG